MPAHGDSAQGDHAMTGEFTEPSPQLATQRLPQALAESTAKAVDATLDAGPAQAARASTPASHEAMRYAIFAGGKRLRPFLVLHSAPAVRRRRRRRRCASAAAIEVLHTYSLVHDDLPCMDDDDLRRGRPTTHNAVRRGDGGAGRRRAADPRLRDPGRPGDPSLRRGARCSWSRGWPRRRGSDGMIGGQMIDMQARRAAPSAPDEIMLLQRLKTGALFEFSCEAGAILGQAAADADRERLRALCPRHGPGLPDHRRPDRRHLRPPRRPARPSARTRTRARRRWSR